MKAKQIILLILLAVAAAAVAFWGPKEYRQAKAAVDAAAKPTPAKPPAEDLPVVKGDQVVMTYFISGARCPSCEKIEAFARTTAEKDFAAEFASGKLVFRVIDTEQPANRHYVDAYKLTSKIVVISHRVDGRETEWQAMGKVWDLLDGERGFRAYLGETLRGYLGT